MKKIFVLLVVLFFSNGLSVLAAEIPVLTIEEATRLAINNSTAIRNLQDNIALTRENEQRIRDTMWAQQNIQAFEFVQMQANLMRADASRAVHITNLNAQRETLSFIVRQHFSNIILAQKELELSDKDIAIMLQNLEIHRVMSSVGMASDAQLNTILSTYNQALHNRANLVSSLDNAFRELNRLMGTNQNNVYSLVFEPNFQPIGNININDYIRLHQNNNSQIENATRQATIASFELEHHGQNFNPITGEVIPGGTTRHEREIAVTQANRNLDQLRETVENNVVTLHNNINNLELQINSAQLQLEILLQELSVLEIQYQVGQVTPITLNRKALEIYRLQETLRRHKVNHSLLVMRLTNPNIVVATATA